MEHDFLLLFYFYLFILYDSNGQLVVIGGVMAGADRTLVPSDEVLIYDPATNEWTSKAVTVANGGRISTGADRTAAVSKLHFNVYLFFKTQF